MIRKIFITILSVCTFGFANAQTTPNLNFYNSRSVAQSSLLNPAHAPRQAFTLGFDFYQNLGVPGFNARDVLSKKDSTLSMTLNTLLGGSQYHFRDIASTTEINPIFLGFRLGKSYISMGVTVTSVNEFSLSKDMVALGIYGNSGDLFRKSINLGENNVKIQEYTSAHFGWSRRFGEKLTIGIRGKYIIGLLDASMTKSNGTILTDSGTNNSLKISVSTDYQFRAAGIQKIQDIQNLQGDSTHKMNIMNDIINPYFNKPVGKGFGIDIGVDYKFTHKFSVSASVIDLGFINWNEGKTYSNTGKLDYEVNLLQDSKSVGDALNHLVDSVKNLFQPNNSQTTYRTSLNTKVYLGFNYQLYNSGALGGAFYTQAFNGKYVSGGSVSFSQRIWRFLDLKANYGYYSGLGANLGAGFAMHTGPITVYAASDNVMGLVDWDKTHWVNVRFGLNLNIGGRFDRDNDGVPDRKDACKKVPGPIKLKGCPDTDGDGISDPNDECVNLPGIASAKGCPDRDSDGVKDMIDSCIDVKGSALLNGCPDKDHDGVADKYDRCPDDSGMVSQAGCPDTDGDGVLDKDDECVDVQGTTATKGCPDRDGDGIADKNDDCPGVPGDAKFNGCPDTDGDGIINKNDSCLGEAGPASTFGCPDTDGDGVADKFDNCPTEAGLKENSGCPVMDTTLVILNEEEKKVLKEAFSNLEFETGTAKISQKSLESLAELAELLTNKTEYNLEIGGHTDNVGKPASNLKLSQNRADAVKNFLISKGIVKTRIKSTGFGSKKPIAENSTPEGRQRNRRVEFKIVK